MGADTVGHAENIGARGRCVGSGYAERNGEFVAASTAGQNNRGVQHFGSIVLAWALMGMGGCGQSANGSEATIEGASASAVASASAQIRDQPSSVATIETARPVAATAEAPVGMAIVDEGVFTMGGESPENTPRHAVAVARFYMDLKEITVDDYAACMKGGACKPMRDDNPFCNARFAGRGDHPVNCIDWNDAEAYCASVGKRLPTEREWEYAARGGSAGNLYAWGNEDPDTTRSCYMHNGGSCEVGTHAAGAFGLFDMTGNVWEWTSSWFGPYPTEATSGRYKVYRGGSWSRRFTKWMRNDLRNRYAVHEHSASVGFRCAKDHAPLTCPKDAIPDHGRCTAAGTATAVPVASGPIGSKPPTRSAAAASAPSPSSAAPADATPVRRRAPGFDADCQKYYPGKPVAYQWSGGSFQAREPLIRAAGCKKRDVGVGWSSACCPG